MTKKEQQESLFSLNIIHGYIKHYALQEDCDRDHCLMHLKSVIEIIEGDRIEILQRITKDPNVL